MEFDKRNLDRDWDTIYQAMRSNLNTDPSMVFSYNIDSLDKYQVFMLKLILKPEYNVFIEHQGLLKQHLDRKYIFVIVDLLKKAHAKFE